MFVPPLLQVDRPLRRAMLNRMRLCRLTLASSKGLLDPRPKLSALGSSIELISIRIRSAITGKSKPIHFALVATIASGRYMSRLLP